MRADESNGNTMRCLGSIIACWLFLLNLPVNRGAALVSSTYFGGTYNEEAYALAVDRQGNICFAGSTQSAGDFPAVSPLQPENAGATDIYVCKLSPKGQILFSTFFGGSGNEIADAIAIDADDNIIIVGFTHSVDFPTTEGSFQPEYGGGTAFGQGDGFIVKLSSDGQNVLYSTYFGGTGDDKISSLALDPEGNLVVAGLTASRNLLVKSASQPIYGGGDMDAFVAEFDRTLSRLLFCTYLGGSAADQAAAVALDAANAIYVAGSTSSTNFPVTVPAFQGNYLAVTNTKVIPGNGFVTKLNPEGAAYAYSTYFMPATAVSAIAADKNGAVYITGESQVEFVNHEIPLGFQPRFGGGKGEVFVAKLQPEAPRIGWFSYLGGSGAETAFALALDDEGNSYLTGMTDSRDFPVRNAIQTTYQGGPADAFLSKVSADGSTLVYSTYLGGGIEDRAYGIALDRVGNAVVAGLTNSRNFPTSQPFQSVYGGTFASIYVDAFIAEVSSAVPAPRVEIAAASGNLVVTWPAVSAGFSLEESNPSVEALAWHTVSTRPVDLGGSHAVILPVQAGAHLFRLRSP